MGNAKLNMIDLSTIRTFGRLPHAPERVAAVAAHTAAGAPPPPEYPGRLPAWTPTLADNTTLPTCVVAGAANDARAWAAAQGYDLPIVDQKLYDLYGALAPCQPTEQAIAATDGLVMLDALQYLAQHGFDYGGPGPMSLTAFRVGLAAEAIREATFARGAVYAGVMLYQSDMTDDAAWHGTPAGAQAGRHCLVVIGYAPGRFMLATWGMVIMCDDDWLVGRIEEAYGLAWGL